MKVGYPFFLAFLALPFVFSCTTSRNIIYFDITKDAITNIEYQNEETSIQKNDVLSITVTSLSAEASKLYNEPNDGVISSKGTFGGYLVNKEGNIQFPVLGTIKAEGLTKKNLQETIARTLSDRKLLLDPIVSIRNLNYKITVLGEVANPGVINVPSEKINLLEAIGFAGDLTLFANRSNVLLIREESNKRTFKLINLNSNDIFNSPYFYLAPNDIIYVEPNKSKIASVSTTRQWLPIVLSSLSVTALVIDRIFR